MNYKILVTDPFKKQAKSIAKKHRSLNKDLENLITTLQNDPTKGEALGKDCYKVRMAITSKGKGKSGGSRVITCVKVVNQTIYMLSIYDKAHKNSISDKELEALIKLAGIQE